MAKKASLHNRIVAELRSPTPPLSTTELAWRIHCKPSTVTSYIGNLLDSGTISISDIPWRVNSIGINRTAQPPAPSALPTSATPLADIEEGLRSIIAANGNDRVAALRALIDIRTMASAADGPPRPNDEPAMLASLTRILQSCGKQLVRRAYKLAFPPAETEATVNETPETTANTSLGPGNGPSGGDLDRRPDQP